MVTPSATPDVAPSPAAVRTLSPTPRLVATSQPAPEPVRALRIDFPNLQQSRAEVPALEQNMQRAGVNMVGLGAGRAEWTSFKWTGHEDRWSSDVRDTNIDFLAEYAARFGKWAHVSAVIDVYAPRYLQVHPERAAISWLGQPSLYLVSTTQLVEGEFGVQLLDMLDYVAGHYPVHSVSLTELAYYTEGYGDDDKAAYLAYTSRLDWPRTSKGQINIDDPSIGKWRSYAIGRFVQRAAETVHRHGKQLFIDVSVSWGHLERESAENGQDYASLLQQADRLLVWDYFDLNGYPPEYTKDIASYLKKYGPDRIIITIGLWGPNEQIISPAALRRAMQAAVEGGLPNLWITPSRYLSDQHWQVLAEQWGAAR